MSRADQIREAMAQADQSKTDVDSCAREWGVAHDLYNAAMTEQPRKGRRSGTDVETLRRHAVGAYEALMDAMRIHHDNLAHLYALRGRL